MKGQLFLAPLVIGLSLVFSGCTDQGEELVEEGLESTEAQAGTTKGSSAEEIPEPPGLVVMAGEETIEAILGTYSWSVDNEDGTITAIEADTAAPPDLVQGMTPVNVTSDTKIALEFAVEPDKYTVRTWEEDYTVSSARKEVLLTREGPVIYEVQASWAQGTARYAFILNIE